MENAFSTGSGASSELGVDALREYLPGLEEFAVEERLAGIYTRYGAIHTGASLPVWVHYFSTVEDSVLAELAARMQQLASLQDPAFLRPLGQAAVEGGLLLVTDAVTDGKRLDTILHELDPGNARKWAGELSDSLGALHELNLVHGRLCPQSIYITPQGPKIQGAGCADLWLPVWEAMDERDEFPPRLFTSLEVRLNGITDGSPAADVLSLGTILYRGYTGGFPGEFCPLPSDKAEVPRSVDSAVMISMHPEAASRQQSMEEFIDEFTV